MDRPAAPPADAGAPRLRRYADLPGDRPLPLIGNLHQVPDLRAVHQALEQGFERFGPIYRFQFGRVPSVVVADPALHQQLMRQRPDRLRRGLRLSQLLDELLGGGGVFSAEGEAWRRQRKLVTRALTPEVVRRFHPQLLGFGQRLVARWREQLADGTAPDLARDLKAVTLDVTVALAMGQDLDTLRRDDNPLQRDIHGLFERIGVRLRTPVPYWRWLRLPADRAADAAAARVQAALRGFVAHARAQLQQDPGLRERPANLMQAFVAARELPDSGLDDAEVLGNALAMVFAGEDTTSATLSWLLIQLAEHPAVAERLAAEVDAVMGLRPALDDPALLEQMPWCRAVIHESMRLKPAAPMLVAEPIEPMVLAGVQLPAGIRIVMPMRWPALQPDRFDQPLAFRPERWLGQGEAALDPNRRMTPFGGGARMCPGRYLALVESGFFLATIVRHFRLQPVPGAPPVQERMTLTLNPSAVPVRLLPRP